MGGTGGDTGKANPALDPSGFNGSRAAASNAAVPSWSGLLSETPPGAVATPAAAASPLVTNPAAPTVAPTAAPTAAPMAVGGPAAPSATALPHIGGFDHTPYQITPPPPPPPPAPPPAVEAPKEFAAPTSFANPWDAAIAATTQLGGKGLFYSDKNWDKNPEAVRQWLQAYADAGGDYRVQDKYYNTVSPGSLKIYWPGDPARPK